MERKGRKSPDIPRWQNPYQFYANKGKPLMLLRAQLFGYDHLYPALPERYNQAIEEAGEKWEEIVQKHWEEKCICHLDMGHLSYLLEESKSKRIGITDEDAIKMNEDYFMMVALSVWECEKRKSPST